MQVLSKNIFYAGLAAAVLSACSASDKESIVPQALISTPQGSVQGVSTDTDGIYNFKGLPFAAPPVEDLRWAAPAPAPQWSDTRMADKFGNRCMQPDSESGYFNRLIEGHGLGGFKNFLIKRYIASQKPSPMSEDCLYLNVRTGNLGKADKQPVMVWIHGGGHSFGSSDLAYYQSNGLVKKDIVLVTINYRLGAFGYMSHPALSAVDPNGVSGNYGTLDQIAALKWVQGNISAYGGDPDNVTIFGESAGAWSVTEMMASPLAKGLFHKAIGQSGSSTYHMIQMDDTSSPYDGQGWPSGYSKGIAAAQALGFDTPSAADLRAVPADEILAKLPEDAYDAFHHQRDGYVFPKNVGLAFRDGDINAVPYLTGYNADEGTLFFPDDPQPTVWLEELKAGSAATLNTVLTAAFPTQAASIIDLYKLDEDFTTAGTQIMGDEIFGTNIVYTARQVEAAGQPSYVYYFSRVPPSKKQTLGAFHAAEIPFVFDSNISILGLTEDDKKLTEAMMTYWTNFAKTSNPNGASNSNDAQNPSDEDQPHWPKHDGKNWMHFSGNTGQPITQVQTHIRSSKLTALDEGLQVKLKGLATVKTTADTPPGQVQSPPSNSAND